MSWISQIHILLIFNKNFKVSRLQFYSFQFHFGTFDLSFQGHQLVRREGSGLHRGAHKLHHSQGALPHHHQGGCTTEPML